MNKIEKKWTNWKHLRPENGEKNQIKKKKI